MKIFSLIMLVGLFLFSINFVAGQSIIDDIKGAEIFTTIKGASADITAQWLLFFLVVLLIFAVSAAIPFLGGKDWRLRGAISIVIGILAVFFLSSEEILTILQTYKALGIALTVIIPFFVIAAVSKQLHDLRHGIMSKLIWILFLGTLVVRYATAEGIGTFGKWAFWITFIASIIMVIWENRIWFMMFKGQIKDATESAAEERLASITSELEEIGAKINAAPSDAIAQPLIQKYNRKVKRQNELGGTYGSWGS